MRSSDGGPELWRTNSTQPNPVPPRFSRLLDGIGELLRPGALEGPGSSWDAKGRRAAVC